jgi:hypothetical protein
MEGRAMSQIVSVVKNQFFTYFSVGTGNGAVQAKYREREQVWNYDGLAIKVQGTSWDGSYNGFGKKHLLTTEGGTPGRDPLDKLASVLAKRADNSGNQNRQGKLKGLVEAAYGPLPRPVDPETLPGKPSKKAQAESIKTQRQADTTTMGSHFESNTYAPATNIVTMILLDGLTKNDAPQAFAEGIRAAGFSGGNGQEEKNVIVSFRQPRVIEMETNGNMGYYWRVAVKVVRKDGVYHVYHCDGGR